MIVILLIFSIIVILYTAFTRIKGSRSKGAPENSSTNDSFDFENVIINDFLEKHPVNDDDAGTADAIPEPLPLDTEILDHVLLWGPPGTGKTTMARIITSELANIYGFEPGLVELTPMTLQNYDDVMKLVKQITPGMVIFIDEIHGIPKTASEALYNILEYGKLLTGEGKAIDLPPITVIGATTEPGTLEEPFRERFLIDIELKALEDDEIYDLLVDLNKGIKYPTTFDEYKGQDEAKMIVWMHLSSLNRKFIPLSPEVQSEIARRATGIPRIAKNISRHMVALAKAINKVLTVDEADHCFRVLGIDDVGLHRSDRRVIKVLLKRGNKPMGIAALAGAAGVAKSDLERTIEGRLVRLGYLERTPRGRQLTPEAIEKYS